MAYVRSVRRGAEILGVLANSAAPLSMSALESQIAISHAQLARDVTSLARSSWIDRDGQGKPLRISQEVLGNAETIVLRRLRRYGPGSVRSLSESTSQAAFIDQLFGTTSVAIAEYGTPDSWLGRAFPLYCDDAGQALLFDADREDLERIFQEVEFAPRGPRSPRDLEDFDARLRVAVRQGYAVVDEESDSGQLAVSAPIRAYSGRVVAAIHILGDRDDIASQLTQMATDVQEHAWRLSARLGWVE